LKPIEKAGLLAHAKTRPFGRRVEMARQLLSDFLDRTERPYVAFSGGKDSTALLGLVSDVARHIDVVWSDDEWHLPETLDYIDRVDGLIRVAGQTRHTDWFTSWEKDRPAGAEWVDADADGALITWARNNGYDGAAIGIRADENAYRRIHIRTYGPLFRAETRQVWQVYPLASWSVRDVWAFILSRGLDYNRAYDRLAEIGVPLDQRRVGPFACETALGYGQLAVLKAGWPDLYERFAAAYPQARCFT